MEHRQVGTTDVYLSVVGLGGAWLGHDVDDATHVSRATDVLRTVDEAGVNWVDTSENYYDTGNEAVIGGALHELNDSFLGVFEGCSRSLAQRRGFWVPTGAGPPSV
jgi:aryl-alcohol dehydrogenase-like predicted oxidoreductase